MQRDAVSLLSVAMLAVVAAASDLSAQTITQLIVTHKTANVARAGTDSPFTLLVRPTTGSLCSRDFPTYDYDEREAGGTDTYIFDVSVSLQREQVDSANVFVRTRGYNAWLPQHFKLIARWLTAHSAAWSTALGRARTGSVRTRRRRPVAIRAVVKNSGHWMRRLRLARPPLPSL